MPWGPQQDPRVSWPLVDPKAELAPRARLPSFPVPAGPAPPRRFRPGRSEGAWGRGPGMAYLPENVGLHEDTDTSEFLAALF